MLKKAIADYYTFFDTTLNSTTFVVLMIATLICAIGLLVPAANADISYMKGSALEIQNSYKSVNTVVINGEKYELIFSKIH